MTQATIDKAARFIRQGRVTRLPSIGGGCKLFLVTGDGDNYTVTVRGRKARCSCRAGQIGKHCSHGLAAIGASDRE